ncbi:autotransporter outer membrane beta-barrel domain-containing protein [Campylobacter sp. RM16188]|uniref:autotransporter outer membrane beta-barrel domain-containing protein n=1 Tax=Campylobacter sp. RM16188 TaxID=1705725 RepID=UPI00155258B8|nr:autotransporter outer membrane beta-barrel domain-containing protein [Campylobacter sp. RM16188]
MKACIRCSLVLSLIATSLLVGAGENITISESSTRTDYVNYISHEDFSTQKFELSGENNILTWDGTPTDIKKEIFSITISAGRDNPAKNILNFNGNTTDKIKDIYGGNGEGIASENTLNLNGGKLNEAAYGAYSEGDAIKNTLNIFGTQFTSKLPELFGGYGSKGNANENKVIINIGAKIKAGSTIYGGRSNDLNNSKEANGNTVEIKGGAFQENVKIYAGRAAPKGQATGNEVILNSDGLDLKNAKIYGGHTGGNTDAFTGNTLNVKSKNIKAGSIHNFEFLNFYIPVGFIPANDKMLTLNTAPDLSRSKVGVAMMHGGVLNRGDNITLIEATNGDIKYPTDMTNHKGRLQAGISALYSFTLAGDPAKKKLFAIVGPPTKLKNLTVNTDTPQAEYEIYDTSAIGREFSLDGSKNSLTWNGTPNYVNENTGIKAGYSDAEDVSENTFNFNANDSSYITHIYAGYSNKRNAINNKLYITGGKILAGAYGALADLDAKNNHVYITGGEFDNSRSTIYGGYSSNNGEASANSITITGWESSNNSKNVDIVGGFSENGKAINNTVNLKADGIILGGIYGGEVSPGSMEENLIGNTLNIRGKNITAAAIENFEKLNFYIPVGFMPATDRMLTLTEAPDLTNSKIGVAMMKGGVLNNGDKVTLIESLGDQITYPDKMENNTAELQTGISAKYKFTLKADETKRKLLAVVELIKKLIIDTTTSEAKYKEYQFGDYLSLEGSDNTLIWDGTPTDLASNINLKAGYSNTGNANQNTLNFNANTTDLIKNLYGGKADNGKAQNNTLNISGGNIAGYAYGGYGKTGSLNNTLRISGGNFTIDKPILYGGYSEGGKAQGNNVIIENSATIQNNTLIYAGQVNNALEDATSNSVTINQANFEDNIHISGGYSNKANATNNSVTIAQAKFGNSNYIHGGYSIEGDTSGNIVSINQATFKSDSIIYCGNSEQGNAINNTVNLNKDSLSLGKIFGGYTKNSARDHFTGNELNIRGKNIRADYIYNFEKLNFYIPDGFNPDTDKMLILNNDIDLKNSKIAAGMAIGASMQNDVRLTLINAPLITYPTDITNHYMDIQTGISAKYKFNLEKDPNNENLYATLGSPSPLVLKNFAVETTTAKSEYKRYLQDNNFRLLESDNTLTWNGTPLDITFDIDIFAGYKFYGNVSDNTLNFNQNNTNHIKEIRAGFAYDGIAIGNKLNISNGNIGISAISGRGSKGALNNTIKILAGDFIGFTKIYAGSSEIRDVINNGIEIENGTFTQEVEIYAGYTHANAVVSNAIKNYLDIKDGSFSGKVKIYSGYSKNGSVEQNSLTISGGSFVDQVEIYGGYSELGDVSNNTINITGGKFAKTVKIYGGRSINGPAINNTINLLNADNLNSPYIYGGSSQTDAFTGNTLNIKNKNINASDVKNFEFLNFYIPVGFSVTNDKMLTLTEAPDLTNSKIGVAMMKGGVLNSGDEVTLIYSDAGIIYPTKENMKNHKNQIQAGISAKYDFTLKEDSEKKKLLAKVVNEETPPENKPESGKQEDSRPNIEKPKENIPEADKPENNKPETTKPEINKPEVGKPEDNNPEIEKPESSKQEDSKPGIEEPKENIPETNRPHLLPYPKNVIETTIGELGMLLSSSDLVSSMSLSTDSNGAFGSTSASNTRLKSGSHVDLKSFNAAAGVAKEFEGNSVGAFVEFGGGKYDSFNDFDKIDVRGNGKFKYIGLGIATKFSLPNNFYLSSSFKAGKIKSDYESDMPAVTTPKYEAKRIYYGMHLGLGKTIDISDISNIDIYSKVLFNKLGEKEIEVDIVGDRILLKPAKSLSAKIGARYNHTINERFDLYTGASCEREFKGEAKGYNLTHNVDIDSPSIKGSTYNAEIGAKLNSTNNLTLDFNLQGMTGKKRGVNGGIGVQWRF